MTLGFEMELATGLRDQQGTIKVAVGVVGGRRNESLALLVCGDLPCACRHRQRARAVNTLTDLLVWARVHRLHPAITDRAERQNLTRRGMIPFGVPV